MWLKAVMVWLLLLMLAIANGAFREAILTPSLGPAAGHMLSTLTLSLLILLLTWATIAWIDVRTRRDAILVGLVWTTLVLAFEFGAGHYWFGESWERLLADYDVAHGRIWIVVPIVTLFAPVWGSWVTARART